ncbi:WhiB family transcriptional regulator [Kitasatospora sp. NPDC085879]|uniref:WhiB family transcriptional regulator n=1 Tax=Kitasatospora sp. NPDC085879 TaxID=3154769 RepID=UPI00342D38B8
MLPFHRRTIPPGIGTPDSRTGHPLSRQHWVPSAACRTTDPRVFFSSDQEHRSQQGEEDAKKICRACPVREPCLTDAIRNQEPVGIWGGLTTKERSRLVNQARQLNTLGGAEAAALRAGRKVHIPAASRPAVVIRLLVWGWDEVRIADALHVSPAAVLTARHAAEAVAPYRHLVPDLPQADHGYPGARR